MAEREKLWILHNRLEGKRPMVVMEENTFLKEILPPPHCAHPAAARIERQLVQNIIAYETFDDDKVVPGFFQVPVSISTEFLGIKRNRKRAAEGLGFHIEPAFENLEEGLPMLKPSVYAYDRESTGSYEKIASDVLGDILPVRIINTFNQWFTAPTQFIVEMMGMENMYCAMMNESDEYHELMNFVTEDMIRCLRWQERQGILFLNNGNDQTGAGNICFTDELPSPGFSGTVRSRDMWGHINSQDSVGISPGQFHEFVFPSLEKLGNQFGLVYYGCCEPVHAYWDMSLSRLPNLRKISISHWCDEAFMAERLASPGCRVIYSRKPSPNFIGIKKEFDEEEFTAYIKRTATLLKNRVRAEFVFRDIYVLNGNIKKVRRAVEITRQVSEGMY